MIVKVDAFVRVREGQTETKLNKCLPVSAH